MAARAVAVEGEVGGLDALVEDLSVAMWARKNAQVHYTLKLEAFRLDQIAERFRVADDVLFERVVHGLADAGERLGVVRLQALALRERALLEQADEVEIARPRPG